MTHIYLIRHGQASFGAQNYDRLSDIGKSQARQVGCYFKQLSQNFDRIVHGDMQRQKVTAELMAESMGFTGQLVVNSALNEFASERVVHHYRPKFLENNETFNQQLSEQAPWGADSRHFEVIFKALMRLWQDDLDCPFESWSQFRHRVMGAFKQQALIGKQAKKLALVTSGGFISVVIQALLELKNTSQIDVNLAINNASVTELILPTDGSKMSLLSFNNVSPLLLATDPALITRK